MRSTSSEGVAGPGNRADRASYRPRRSAAAVSAGGGTVRYLVDDADYPLTPAEAAAWELCDGTRTVPAIVQEVAARLGPREAETGRGWSDVVSAALGRFRRHGLVETIEETVLNELIAFHGAHLRELWIADICTGDYFTAVRLSDGSQGAAINFNNVSGPHRVTYNYRHYDSLLVELARTDGVLLDTFLSRLGLDCLAKSVKIAILNALSREFVTADRLRDHSLALRDGYLDLASFLREGDTVAMIGCTGNYSCPEVGKVPYLKKVYFSDFEYTDPFKAGIEECIRTFFRHPEKVELSDGRDNEAICRASDVVVIIADTICTNTLDELLAWSAGARDVLMTGRSYVMDPVPVFHRGASGMTTQRIVAPDFVGFVRDKLRRREYGFTDSLVECFQRQYVVQV